MKRNDIYKVIRKYASSGGVLYLVLFLFIAVSLFATPPQDDNRRRQPQRNQPQQGNPSPPSQGGGGGGSVKAQPKLVVEDETIPDSLLNARWKIKKTAPMMTEDLDSAAIDLKTPDNIKQQVEYDDSLNLYYVGSKIGDGYLNAPILMTPDDCREDLRSRRCACEDAGNSRAEAGCHHEEHRQPLAAHPQP